MRDQALLVAEAALFGIALAAVGYMLAGIEGIGGAFVLVLIAAAVLALTGRLLSWP